MSLYVKKNGVVKKLAGVPKGWNAVKKFNVPATAWEANIDTQTSSTYPYIAEIETDYFSDDSAPTWQMNGVGTLPTETELPSINMILDAIFLSTGVTLYATDQPTEDLVLETGMFVKGYSTSAAPAADISFDPSSTDLSSTNVQDAIVELDVNAGCWSAASTCAMGSTVCTIVDSNITTSSIIEDYSLNASGTKIVVPQITVTAGQAELTFDALAEDTSFRLHIINLT